MQKKEEAIPLRRVCINLRKGDYEWLQSTHDQSPSETIRKIIIGFRRKVEAKAAQRMPSIHDIDLDMEDVIG
jgi:hypothetical protein